MASPSHSPAPATVSVAAAAGAGTLAAGAALGVGELVAGLFRLVPSPVVAVGQLLIDSAPPALEDFAIETFGTADKPALVIGIACVALAVGSVLGLIARRSRWLGVAGFLAFGALGALAVARDPRSPTGLSILTAASAAAVGAGALLLLLTPRRRERPTEAEPPSAQLDRRAFLRAAGGVAALAAVSAGAGRLLARRTGQRAAGSRAGVTLPRPASPLAPPGPTASLDVPGLTPVVTSNDRFYRVDTALAFPEVALEDWRLQISGMVDRPHMLTFDELLRMPLVEEWVTLACVSNRVGGDLVGNARWLGVRLSDILERAGVQNDAEQIVGRSADGFTVGFPTAAAFDGRDALVAVGMNGDPLPLPHGFPARLVVAGLYGYVSATKWLTEIELATWDGFDAYWVPRGWAKEAPVKTQSRIDVPWFGATLIAGTRPVAGVAFAPDRGISRVEVQVDERPWAEARLSDPLDENSWRQWVHEWEATPGRHVLRVRATDGDGKTQTGEIRPPRPDGATGYHTIEVQVAEG